MSKTIIVEGKTTNEAIEKGLKQLKVTRDHVQIKFLEDEKRSFFSILTPRVVKIEMTLKDLDDENKVRNNVHLSKKEVHLSKQNQFIAKQNVEKFLAEFIKELPEGATYVVDSNDQGLSVSMSNEKLGFLIGYRGETLYALQAILSSIASKNVDQRVRVILDIEGYKEKREKTLEDLAEKIAKTVVKTRKSITLEPMQPYERKIIHSRLQENSKVQTISVGEEPHRKIVISLKNK